MPPSETQTSPFVLQVELLVTQTDLLLQLSFFLVMTVTHLLLRHRHDPLCRSWQHLLESLYDVRMRHQPLVELSLLSDRER